MEKMSKKEHAKMTEKKPGKKGFPFPFAFGAKDKKSGKKSVVKKMGKKK